MIRYAGAAEHNAVEPVVALEAAKNFEPETISIERNQGAKVIARARNPHSRGFTHQQQPMGFAGLWR